jgi:hypothetical protein
MFEMSALANLGLTSSKYYESHNIDRTIFIRVRIKDGIYDNSCDMYTYFIRVRIKDCIVTVD